MFQQYVAFMAAAFGLDLDAFEGDALRAIVRLHRRRARHSAQPCSGTFALQPPLLHHAGFRYFRSLESHLLSICLLRLLPAGGT